MPRLLADVNLHGHLAYLEQRLVELDLLEILTNDLGLEFVTFTDLGLDHAVDDRKLWSFCQQHHWILFT